MDRPGGFAADFLQVRQASSLGLADEIGRAVTERGYSVPIPIQMQAIPAVLSGGDLLAGGQTGTGKLAEQLNTDGIKSLAIHGNKSQSARTRALAEFKDNSLQVLVDIEKVIKRSLPKEIVAAFELDPNARAEPIQNGSRGRHNQPRVQTSAGSGKSIAVARPRTAPPRSGDTSGKAPATRRPPCRRRARWPKPGRWRHTSGIWMRRLVFLFGPDEMSNEDMGNNVDANATEHSRKQIESERYFGDEDGVIRKRRGEFCRCRQALQKIDVHASDHDKHEPKHQNGSA